jgi:hypothetical protein
VKRIWIVERIRTVDRTCVERVQIVDRMRVERVRIVDRTCVERVQIVDRTCVDLMETGLVLAVVQTRVNQVSFVGRARASPVLIVAWDTATFSTVRTVHMYVREHLPRLLKIVSFVPANLSLTSTVSYP